MHGYFFKVDNDSIPGQVVFRYLPVHINNDKEKRYHHFPVYVVLKPFALDFFYHGPDAIKGTKGEDIHINVCILHLPLSLNLAVKDNLTQRLSSMYNNKFYIGEDYEFDISDQSTTYWNLTVFKGDDEEILSKDASNHRTQIILRKLILDFLYDLEYSNVFEASPNYEEIEVHLRENFFFNAIAAKAAYYYNRKAYVDNANNDAVSDIYAKRLAGAETQWLNIIRDSRAVESFSHQKWFLIVEEEYNNVLFSKKFSRDKWRSQLVDYSSEDYAERNKKILRESARWYLRRYNFSKGMKSIFQYYTNRKILIFLLAVISFLVIPSLIYSYNYKSGLIYNNIIDKVIAYLFYTFLGIIPFVVIVSFILYKMFLPLLSAMLPRLLMAIASAWLFFSTTEELIKSSFDVRILDIHKIWVFLLLIPVVAFMTVEISNMAPDIGAKTLIKRMGTLLGIGAVSSLLIGMFFINSLVPTILKRSNYLYKFYSFEVDSLENKGIDTLYMKTDQSVTLLDPTFTPKKGNELHKFLTNPNSSDKEKYKYLNFVKYNIPLLSSYSFRLRYLVPIYNKNKDIIAPFEIFPGMLIYRAIFALFIGIFIQLIFEDKPITEPL